MVDFILFFWNKFHDDLFLIIILQIYKNIDLMAKKILIDKIKINIWGKYKENINKNETFDNKSLIMYL